MPTALLQQVASLERQQKTRSLHTPSPPISDPRSGEEFSQHLEELQARAIQDDRNDSWRVGRINLFFERAKQVRR